MPERIFTSASVPVARQPSPAGPSPVPTVTLGEYAQAKIRCWMNLVLITLALVAYRYQPSISLQTIWYTFVFTAVEPFPGFPQTREAASRSVLPASC